MLPLFDVCAPDNRYFDDYGEVIATSADVDYASENERTSSSHSFVFDPFRSDVNDHLDDHHDPMGGHSGTDYADGRLWGLFLMTHGSDYDHAMTENPLAGHRFPIYEAY